MSLGPKNIAPVIVAVITSYLLIAGARYLVSQRKASTAEQGAAA